MIGNPIAGVPVPAITENMPLAVPGTAPDQLGEGVPFNSLLDAVLNELVAQAVPQDAPLPAGEALENLADIIPDALEAEQSTVEQNLFLPLPVIPVTDLQMSQQTPGLNLVSAAENTMASPAAGGLEGYPENLLTVSEEVMASVPEPVLTETNLEMPDEGAAASKEVPPLNSGSAEGDAVDLFTEISDSPELLVTVNTGNKASESGKTKQDIAATQDTNKELHQGETGTAIKPPAGAEDHGTKQSLTDKEQMSQIRNGQMQNTQTKNEIADEADLLKGGNPAASDKTVNVANMSKESGLQIAQAMRAENGIADSQASRETARTAMPLPEPANNALVKGMVDRISMALQEGKSQAVMELKPSIMGKLKIALVMEKGELVALMKVDNPIAKEAIQGQLAQLKEALEAQGLKLSSCTVGLSADHETGDKAGHKESGKQQMRGFGEEVENMDSPLVTRQWTRSIKEWVA